MFSPRGRTLSDSMDYDDELAELHDRRERELMSRQAGAVMGGVGGGGLGLSSIPIPGPSGLGGGVSKFNPLQDIFRPHHPQQESDEDTEDASEDGDARHPFRSSPQSEKEHKEIKEQVYQDKMAFLKAQLEELEAGNHVDYNRGVERLKNDYKQRLENIQVANDYERSCIERDYSNEQKLIGKEFEEKKIEIRDGLINELEEKRKQIEMDRYSLELNSDPAEVKPITTRKLRRRPNDPAPVPERRKKPPTCTTQFTLDEKEIDEDMKEIQNAMASGGMPPSGKGKKDSYRKGGASQTVNDRDIYYSENSHFDARIEDGKLFYEKRWFHRGQPVFVEGPGMPKTGGVISSISQDLVLVRKMNDQSKIRVPIASLQKGKLCIKRRAS